MVARTSTFANNSIIIDSNMRLQSQYAEKQFQISSGLISDNYKGIGRDTQKLLNVEGDHIRLKSYNEDAKIIASRVNIMYNAMTNLVDTAQSFLGQITAALGNTQFPTSVVQAFSNNAMDAASTALNVSSGGRYLFSGTAIETAPVDLSDPAWVAQTPPSVANSTYYQGTNVILSTQISDTMTIDYGVLASNPAFEQMFRAYNLAANNPGNRAALEEAHNLITSAVQDISVVQGILSANSKTLEDQIDRNDNDLAVTESIISSLKEVDMAAATIAFNQFEVQLEASYATSSRLLRLSLTNFL